MKNTITLLTASLFILFSCQEKEKVVDETKPQETVIEQSEETVLDNEMCFLQVVSKDTIFLTVKKEGNDISGTYKSLPYEKDRKTIVFSGSLSGNTVNATGTAMAEGMTVQEEFIFTLDNDQAGIKFGEMIQGDDGVYRYKNKNAATALMIKRINCD